MANVVINETHLEDIADAIRNKAGTQDLYKPRDMAAAIDGIECLEPHIPEEAYVISGDCNCRFAYSGWDWFLEEYRDKITTEKITSTSKMFAYSYVEEIPFDINIADSINGVPCSSMFESTYELRKLPYVKGKIADANRMLNTCNIAEIPEDWADYIDWDRLHTYAYANFGSFLSGSQKLRRIPDSLMSNLYGVQTSSSYSSYYRTFNGCYSLSEIKNLPIQQVALTANQFDTTVAHCFTLKDFTFATQNDGSPYTANWKNQTIAFYGNVGWSADTAGTIRETNFTEDTLVQDDAQYQALKNHPDMWTTDVAYSRYNHDSAVETINSLPDTSAYLAANGGTNTIKFKGEAGSATDGGAINTLTEEEIAVATAKGWTTTFK